MKSKSKEKLNKNVNQKNQSLQFHHQTIQETSISTTVTMLSGTVFNSSMFYYYENSHVVIKILPQNNANNNI